MIGKLGRLFFLAVLLSFGYFAWMESQPIVLTSPVVIEIEPGTGSRAIAQKLQHAGVLRSPWPFLALHYLSPARKKLKAGEYQFEGSSPVWRVHDKLARGDIFYHPFTIPEGFNVFDIAAAAEQQGFCKSKDFLVAAQNPHLVSDIAPNAVSLEGFLFPDTYRFARRTTPKEMVAKMVERFRKVYGEVTRSAHANVPAVLQVVTLASMVEKETARADERPLVAGVFQNRLGAGMKLQCDPTVVYAAVLEGKYRGTIYASDLARESKYNTYFVIGLPPGPVANPGRASLEAAVSPAETPYMYFVSDSAGGHVFSKTLGEHERHTADYRKKSNKAG